MNSRIYKQSNSQQKQLIRHCSHRNRSHRKPRSSGHKGLNTGRENGVTYLAAHRVVKTSAYLKFKCGMKSISEFCVTCGQIENLEHLFHHVRQPRGCGKNSPQSSRRFYLEKYSQTQNSYFSQTPKTCNFVDHIFDENGLP